MLTSSAPNDSNWYVTNGEAVVGPIDTELLLRGVSAGKVHNDCYIAQPNWGCWRPLTQVREVRALLRGTGELPAPQFDQVEAPLLTALPFARARDDDEVFKLALKFAVEQTHADVGVVHRDLAPHIGLVTTHAYGRGMKLCLGRVVPWHDAAREAAQLGKTLLAKCDDSDWSRVSKSRLSLIDKPHVAGVALVSVPVFREHRALIELGHYSHVFRSRDADFLDTIVDGMLLRLEQLAF